MHLPYIRKARFLPNLPTNWITASVLTIAAGLSDAQIRLFQLHNLVRRIDLAQLLRHSPLRSEFGQLAFLSYIISIRVPSGMTQLARAFSNDLIDAYEKQDTTALIGVR